MFYTSQTLYNKGDIVIDLQGLQIYDTQEYLRCKKHLYTVVIPDKTPRLINKPLQVEIIQEIDVDIDNYPHLWLDMCKHNPDKACAYTKVLPHGLYKAGLAIALASDNPDLYNYCIKHVAYTGVAGPRILNNDLEPDFENFWDIDLNSFLYMFSKSKNKERVMDKIISTADLDKFKAVLGRYPDISFNKDKIWSVQILKFLGEHNEIQN